MSFFQGLLSPCLSCFDFYFSHCTKQRNLFGPITQSFLSSFHEIFFSEEQMDETRSRNHCYHGKAINIKYSECLSVALVMENAKRMRRILLSSVVCLAGQHFTLSYKRHEFGGGEVFERKTRVLNFCTTLVWNISHRKKNWARYHECTWIFV